MGLSSHPIVIDQTQDVGVGGLINQVMPNSECKQKWKFVDIDFAD